MARPKGISKKSWEYLRKRASAIRSFFKKYEAKGVEFKNKPKTIDIQTREGRRAVKKWRAKEQWKSGEYQSPTGETYTGTSARKQAIYEESLPRVTRYDSILSRISSIPDYAYTKRTGRPTSRIHMKQELIDALNDLYATLGDAQAEKYLAQHEGEMQQALDRFTDPSDGDNIRQGYTIAFHILNGGKAMTPEQAESVEEYTSMFNTGL